MTQPPWPGQPAPHPGLAAPPPPARPRTRLSDRGRELVGLVPFVGASVLLLVVVLVLGSLTKHGSVGNLLDTTIKTGTATALYACALATTLYARSIDLSIVGTASLCALVFASVGGGVPGVAVALLVALVVGVVTAALVGLLGFNSVATTLATGLIMTTIVLATTHGRPVVVREVLPGAVVYVVLVLLVLAAIALDIVHLLVPRRRKARAFLHRCVAHLVAAGLAGVGGVVHVIVLRVSVADTSWWILVPALAAAFLGGTSASGHARSFVGALVAAMFLATTTLVIALMGWSPYLGQVLVGIVLVLAVGGDRLRDLLSTPKASTPPRSALPAQ